MCTACVVGRATAASGGRDGGRGQRYKHQHVAAAEPWHDPRPAWADVRLRQFPAEGRGRGGRVIAAVKRLLDCSLGRVDVAIDDLLYKGRVKGLLGIVSATCHVLEGGRRHVGKARALLRVILQSSKGSLQAQCRRRSLVRSGQGLSGRTADGGREGSDWRRLGWEWRAQDVRDWRRFGLWVWLWEGSEGVSFFFGVSSPALRWPTALAMSRWWLHGCPGSSPGEEV